MASSRDIRAGGAFVEIYADRNPLKKGLDSSWKDIQKFASRANREIGEKLTKAFKVAAAGAVGLGAGIAVMAKSAITELDQLNKTAKAFGLTAEAASGVFGVMRASGATNIRENIESLVTLADRVQQAATSEPGKGGQGEQLFAGLNVTAKQMARLDPAEQFFRLHEAIMDLENPVERVNKLMLAFGEDGGKTLIGSLSQSTDELRRMSKELGNTQAQLDAASKAQLAMNRLSAEWNKIVAEIAVTMAPAFETISIAIREMLTDSNKVDDAFQAVSLSIEIIWRQMLDRMDGAFTKFVSEIAGKFKLTGRTSFFDVEHEFLAGQLMEAVREVDAAARNKERRARDGKSQWGKRAPRQRLTQKAAEELVENQIWWRARDNGPLEFMGLNKGPGIPDNLKKAMVAVARGEMTPEQFDVLAGQYVLDSTNNQTGLADLIKERDALIEKILKDDAKDIRRAVEAGRPEVIRPDAVEAPKPEETEAEEFRAISQYNDAIYSGTREAAEAIAKAMLPASDQLQKKQLANLEGINKGVAKLVKKDDISFGVA